jgi:hypothetical protein
VAVFIFVIFLSMGAGYVRGIMDGIKRGIQIGEEAKKRIV